MSAPEEFFIGWARGIATGLRRFLLPIGLGVLLGLPVMGVLLGGAADDPADAHFGTVPGQTTLADLPSQEALRGIILDGPSPLLHLPADARHLRGRTLLLAGDGKTAAPIDAAMLRGRLVAAEGYVVRRGTIEMLVIGTAPSVVDGAAVPAPPPIERLGRWRITGEICDGKCAAGSMRPGTGLAHRACATLCLDGDIPAIFVPTGPVEGQSFLLLADRDGRPPLPAMRDLIGHRVTLDGNVERRGALLVFRAETP